PRSVPCTSPQPSEIPRSRPIIRASPAGSSRRRSTVSGPFQSGIMFVIELNFALREPIMFWTPLIRPRMMFLPALTSQDLAPDMADLILPGMDLTVETTLETCDVTAVRRAEIALETMVFALLNPVTKKLTIAATFD